jgi:hypothetical protein
MDGFLPVVVSFFFFPAFLSLLTKVYVCPIFFSFYFSILVLSFLWLILVLIPFEKVFYVFNFIIELQFIMDYCFGLGLYYFFL